MSPVATDQARTKKTETNFLQISSKLGLKANSYVSIFFKISRATYFPGAPHKWEFHSQRGASTAEFPRNATIGRSGRDGPS